MRLDLSRAGERARIGVIAVLGAVARGAEEDSSWSLRPGQGRAGRNHRICEHWRLSLRRRTLVRPSRAGRFAQRPQPRCAGPAPGRTFPVRPANRARRRAAAAAATRRGRPPADRRRPAVARGCHEAGAEPLATTVIASGAKQSSRAWIAASPSAPRNDEEPIAGAGFRER